MWSKNIILLVMIVSAFSASADDFSTLRLRWKDMLTGGTNLNVADADIAHGLEALSAAAQPVWDALDKSAQRKLLWPDLPDTAANSAQITISYDRLKTMALAYATHGTSLEGNASLRADLISALDWMNANRYSASKTEYGNWWDWEIGTPLLLNDITVLLYDQLTAAQVNNYMNAVDHFTPKATRTAANRVWQASVIAVRGAVVGSSAKLATGRDALSAVFPYVTSSDGFYADGSFIQHDIYAYTGGYGQWLMATMGPMMAWLNGSSWQVTDVNRKNVYRWISESYQPLIYNGAMMEMSRGRQISRLTLTDHDAGASIINGIIRCAQFAPPAEAASFQSMVKYWLQADTARSFVGRAPVPLIPIAKQILEDTNIVSRGELIGHYRFPRMDRVVHLRPGFGLGLSMSSSRVANYESINVENVHGWYTGEGMTYLYNRDAAQFSRDFWPTVDPYRLPGTTVDTQRRADVSGQGYRSTGKWVGGASLGAWGATGMELDAYNSTLVAKKSWFMFDDEVVALGAGITSTDKRTIETIVENRQLTDAGDNAFTVNGEAQPAGLPWSDTRTNVSWAHLAGNVSGSDIGYYFPQPTALKELREARTKSWREINAKTGTTNLHTRNYLTLWFDHGVNPAARTYAYVLLPNKTPAEVAGYAASPDIVVLENSTRAQAVREIRLNVTAANFWSDGVYSIGGITVDKKAAVLVQSNGAELEVAVSDPTQANSSTINVEIASSVTGLISADAGVTVVALSPHLKLSVNVKGAVGRTFRAKFQQAVAPVVSPAPLALVVKNVATQANSSDAKVPSAASVEAAAPRLTIQPVRGGLLLSWPTNLSGYHLQQVTDSLGLGTNWADVPGASHPPLLLPVSPTNTGVFFRLKAQ